jgi:hypothetical protein
MAARSTYIVMYASEDMSRRRTNIYLDAAQLDALRERALATRRSTADLVREAVDGYLAPALGPVVRAAPASLPAGDYPRTAADWDRRPYFLHEAQVSWAEFVAGCTPPTTGGVDGR